MSFLFVGIILFNYAWLIEASPRGGDAAIAVDSIRKYETLSEPPILNLNSRMYSYDSCETFADCDGYRFCYDPDTNRRCEEGIRCFCSADPFTNCSTSADCLSNDRCYQDVPNGRCISCNASDAADGLDPVDDGNCENGEHGSNISPGYAFIYCHEQTDCVSPRECFGSAGACNTSSDWCLCSYPTHFLCTTSDDCLENDRCVVLGSDVTLCASCVYTTSSSIVSFVDDGNCQTFSPSPFQSNADEQSPDPSKSSASSTSTPPNSTRSPNPRASETQEPTDAPGVCIAADALVGLDALDMVFAENRRAGVLCDQFDSCATPGHMVEFRGRAMGMKDYCAKDGIHCVKRTKLVNSPKMKMGLRIQSKSTHLMFTAFSASKETWLETRILAALLRLGV